MYYKSNQIQETIEVCSAILEELPFCFVANDLMARILINENRENEAQTYLSRLYEIDPYIEKSDFPSQNPNDVADNEVMVDLFETQFEIASQNVPNTASLLGNDWNSNYASQLDLDEINQQSEQQIEDDENLPDWLKSDSGLENLPSELEEQVSIESSAPEFEELSFEEKVSESDDLSSDNWLDQLKESEPTEEKEDDESDWLKQLGAISDETIDDEDDFANSFSFEGDNEQDENTSESK